MPRCLALLLGALALHAGGCAAVPAATLGPLLGLTASAVSTGGDIYQLGKLETAEMARFDQTVAAARRAAAELCLRHRGDERRKRGGLQLAYADARGAGLKVRVQPRTATLVRIRIDVGWFGSEATARLFLSRMRAHLPRPAVEEPGRNDPEPPPDGQASEAAVWIWSAEEVTMAKAGRTDKGAENEKAPTPIEAFEALPAAEKERFVADFNREFRPHPAADGGPAQAVAEGEAQARPPETRRGRAKIVSLSIERELLRRADALAKK